jgi:hypothetical protein
MAKTKKLTQSKLSQVIPIATIPLVKSDTAYKSNGIAYLVMQNIQIGNPGITLECDYELRECKDEMYQVIDNKGKKLFYRVGKVLIDKHIHNLKTL